MADLSKYSDEELDKMESDLLRKSSNNSSYEQPGLFKSLGQGYLNYAKGAIRGTGQAMGDIGASAINAPISIAEHLSGSHLPHVPHPHLINEHPESLGENIGQILGQLTGGLEVPGGAALKTAELANLGYKGLRAGKELPLIGKLIAGSAGGAIEGGLGNEENRKLGAGIGALTGSTIQGVNSAFNLPLRSKNIAKDVENEVKRMDKDFNNRFTTHLNEGEKAGANEYLNPEKSAKIPLLKKAGQAKLAHGIQEYNKSPTLTNAHKAQSDLNKIVNRFSKSREGSLEADAYDEALKLKNRILQKISEAFEKSGAKKHGEGYQKARVDYAKEAGPYLNSPTIKGYMGKNKSGARTVRPGQFADKLLQEEDFLARAGHKHPGLLHREIAKNIIKHPVAKLGAVAGASYLPYEIRKLLEHH